MDTHAHLPADGQPRVAKKAPRRLAILWALAILVACLFPGNELPEVDVPLADKWVHFVLFGVQVILLLWAQSASDKAGPAGKDRIAGRAFLVVLFGAAVEVLQWITHPLLHRQFDMGDIAANAIGVMLGTLFFWLVQRFYLQKTLPES